MNTEVGLRLRELRVEYNLSIEKLADILDISPGFLGLIERGERGITLPRLVELCEIFHVQQEYLTTGNGEQPKKFADNPMEFLKHVLNEHQLLQLSEFGKVLSLHSLTEEEVDLLFGAISSQLEFLISVIKAQR